MSAPSPAPRSPPRRRWFAPRFSLRTMLIVVTLLCLTLAPMMPELNRARSVARQVEIIQEMGGRCVFVDRPGNAATWLVSNCWPVRVEHLDHDLLMAEFNEQTVDPARLHETPDVRGVVFNECQFEVTGDDAANVPCPKIEYVQLQERTDSKGGPGSLAFMRRFPKYFPNLRKVQLMGMPQDQEFIDQLSVLEPLEDLDLWFGSQDWFWPKKASPVDSAPLGNLANLRRLRLSGTAEPWDWSFLERLHNLRDVELGTLNEPIGEFIEPRPKGPDSDDVALASKLPSHELVKLMHLRAVRLFEWSDSRGQLETLAKNNDLEVFRIPHYWPSQPALETLSREPNLRRLEGVRVEDGASDRVFQALKAMPALRELEIQLRSLTDEDLRRMSELSRVEWISLTFNPEYGHVTSEGIALFQQLPVKELNYKYSSGAPMAEGMQRVINNWQGSPGGVVEPQYAEGKRFLLQAQPLK